MDIIHLLSDSIANQIAAGEVIQRPASAVKELVENAVDAGADRIQINIKDAGRTLIQVCDNGKGMSEMDARMAFERHATSKINAAQDLFSLRTLGFRGEALASIAAVAQVELRTKRAEDETGTMVQISGSVVERHEPVGIANGSTFSVRNLFYNIPARRKFLKSNETEFKNILTEFERIALVNPDRSFCLSHNETEVYNLPSGSIKQRIINVFGNKLKQQLIPVNVNTSLVNLSGFIGNPDSAKKRGASQFFFVNNRYMRHPYFARAVAVAFEPYIPTGFQPNFYLYLTVDPGTIDVNIHPTKTEIKFENEQAIWHIISTAVKEAIAMPVLEFDRDGAFEMPVYKENKSTPVEMPKVSVRKDYNPFKEHGREEYTRNVDWQSLYKDNETSHIEHEPSPKEEGTAASDLFHPSSIERTSVPENLRPLIFRNKYLVASMPGGLTIIDQRRAHIRILYDEYLLKIKQQQGVSQGLLFPEIISFTPKESTALPYLLDDFAYMGFDLADLGSNSYSINGIPQGLDNIDIVELLQDMVDEVLETGCEVKDEASQTLALTLARKAAIPAGKPMTEEEVQNILSRLLQSESPNYTPDGKLIMWTLTEEDLISRFK